MANKKVSIAQLSDAVSKILDEYKDDVADATDDAVDASSKEFVKDLKKVSASNFGGTGKYAKGWTRTKTATGRGKLEYTVHNKAPGLPHLLEHGHVKIAWGKATGERVSGRSHITPAEEKMEKDFIRKVEEGIKNA